MMRIFDIASANFNHVEREKLHLSRHAPGTLVVSDDTPALDVARAVDSSDAQLVICVDPSGEITGFVGPHYVRTALRQWLQIDALTLFKGLEEMESRPDQKQRGFHHEWLTNDPQGLFWCESGKHMTSKNPCPEH